MTCGITFTSRGGATCTVICHVIGVNKENKWMSNWLAFDNF